MRLNQLRDLIAVVEAGSLRSAAAKVGVSQPAISKSIRQLEQELQVQLLQRNARGAAVTRAGKAFLARARVIQSELRKAEDDLQVLRGGEQGSVAFGVAPSVCMLLVPDSLQHFRHSQPTADVRVVEGASAALVVLVRDETLDFCVSQKPAARLEPALRFKPLFRPPLAVVGRRGHPRRAAKSLRELADDSWLMFNPRRTGGAVLKEMFDAAGLSLPRSIVHCESYATALSLVAKTDVLGLLNSQMVSEVWGQRYLQKIDIEETVPAPLLGLYSRADTPLTPTALAMAQAVTATARRIARTG
jgi:LysR family transcriptional regulator, regulator of abg operon